MAYKYTAIAIPVSRRGWSSNLQADVHDAVLTVYEEPDWVFTGLYDHRGAAIYKQPDKVKMGFQADG